jgi:hypothetical protein
VAETWPEWWEWELELTPHIEKRMTDRDFSEVDLRLMLQNTSNCEPDIIKGRWSIWTTRNRRPWRVIVEPDHDRRLLVVVTAYPLSES